MKDIIKKIFNFELQEGGIKYKLHILGIKITIPTLESIISNRKDPFYYYKKNNVDITTLPKAQGQLRDMQLANLAIMKEFDKFCRENNLSYWLEYGTLLGAVRHKGYIPWDDDIDVSMTREDYDRFIEIYEEKCPNSKLFVKQVMGGKNVFMTKLSHKDCPLLFVDIFPHDYCKKHNSKEEKIETKKKIIVLRENFAKKVDIKNMTPKELYAKYTELKNSNYEFEKRDENKEQDLIHGIEFGYFNNNFIESYEDIYPLKEYDFEGYKFFSVNNADVKLREIYGNNYMGYPPKLTYGHSRFFKLSQKDKEVIEELKKEVENK